MEKFVLAAEKLYHRNMLTLDKKITSFIIWIMAAACIIFFGFGDYLRLAGYAISIILIMLPVYLYDNWNKFKKVFTLEFIQRTQLVVAISCYLNLLGSADFYFFNSHTVWYDTLIHFINPIMIFSLTAAIPILLQKILFKKSNLLITIISNIILIIFFSFLWEFYESFIDMIFKNAQMFGDNNGIFWDTINDLSADFMGGIIACWLIYSRFYGYILKNVKIN